MTIKKADLKRGMWLFLGEKQYQGHTGTHLAERLRLFDYRQVSPLNDTELKWYSQQSNPFKIIPHQITKMSPLTCKFKAGSGYYTLTFRINEITHAFETHTEFIVWRDQFLKDERDQIRELHQQIRKDKMFWRARRDELRHWNRVDDLKGVKKI